MKESKLEAILEERGKTNGDFNEMCATIQKLKQTMLVGHMKRTSAQNEAIDMICHKLGRIAAGDPNKEDHWRDIAGYATLVADRV